MSVVRRVRACWADAGGNTVTALLECGHEVTLYRLRREGRTTWVNRRGQPTGRDARSRECAECGAVGRTRERRR